MHGHSGGPTSGRRRQRPERRNGLAAINPAHREETMNEHVIQNEPELLRVIEAAKMLALSRTKVYEMADRGEIPTVKIGSAVRIPRRKLLDWIEAQTNRGRP
jgi:excisionase family DNA binding protein